MSNEVEKILEVLKEQLGPSASHILEAYTKAEWTNGMIVTSIGAILALVSLVVLTLSIPRWSMLRRIADEDIKRGMHMRSGSKENLEGVSYLIGISLALFGVSLIPLARGIYCMLACEANAISRLIGEIGRAIPGS